MVSATTRKLPCNDGKLRQPLLLLLLLRLQLLLQSRDLLHYS